MNHVFSFKPSWDMFFAPASSRLEQSKYFHANRFSWNKSKPQTPCPSLVPPCPAHQDLQFLEHKKGGPQAVPGRWDADGMLEVRETAFCWITYCICIAMHKYASILLCIEICFQMFSIFWVKACDCDAKKTHVVSNKKSIGINILGFRVWINPSSFIPHLQIGEPSTDRSLLVFWFGLFLV